MVPDIAKKGHSFKGAFAYYLHDKRQAEGPHPATAERVAWSETRNLATDDPETAKRIMIATAQQAEELKRAAGGAKAGRKGTAGQVYAYSLAWHPEEAGKIDRAEMRRAADATLKILGADHLQAVIVCHQDEPQPHVHVIVNRVDPATGKLHPFSNDRHQLDGWALAYREARGEERKYCPARAEKAAAIKAQKAGIAVPFSRAAKAPDTKRPSGDFHRAAEVNDNQAPLETADTLRARTADLAKASAAMRTRHTQEWRDLSDGYKADRGAAYDRAAAAIDAKRATVKEEYRPFWRDLFKQQAAERKAFNRLGLMTVALTAWKAAQYTSEARGSRVDRGWLTAAFAFVVSRKAREAVLTARHARQQRQLAGLQGKAADHAAKPIKANRDREFDAARKAFAMRRAEIIERQAREKEADRGEWRDLTAAKQAFTALRTPRREDPASRNFQTAGEIRAAYVQTVGKDQQARGQGRDRTRTRSRVRTRDAPTPTQR